MAMASMHAMSASDTKTSVTTAPGVTLMQHGSESNFSYSRTPVAYNNSVEEGTATYPLTIVSRPEPNGTVILPRSIFVYDEKGARWQMDGDMETIFNLPEGIYNVQVNYDFSNDHITLFYPDIQLYGPMTINQSYQDATVTIAPTFILPDGTEAELPKYDAGKHLINRPNIDMLLASCFIQFKGMTHSILLFQGDYASEDYDNLFSMSTNITTEDAEFVWMFQGWNADNLYCTSITASPSKVNDGYVSNNPSDYRNIAVDFSESLAGDEKNTIMADFAIYNSEAVKQVALNVSDIAPLNCWFCSDNPASGTYSLLSISKILEPAADITDVYRVTAPWIGVEDGHTRYYNTDMDVDYDVTYTTGMQLCSPINPYFTLNVDESPVFGSSGTFFKTGMFDGSWAPTPFRCPYPGSMYGFYGELWRGFEKHAKFTVSDNGQIVGEGALSDFIMWNIENSGTCSNTSLKYIFSMDHAIDGGVESATTCEIYYNTRLDNPTPPILQHVMLHDNTGRSTNHFSKSSDGTISLAGGGFIMREWSTTTGSAPQYYIDYEYSPAEMSVEYAPCGSEEFTPLEVQENTDKFFMPGSGAFWEGSLSGITRPSRNGWYDLRITLTDKDGNYQRQTITNALKVEELAGIETMPDDNLGEAEVTDVYNLQGIKITNPSVGSLVIERLSDGTARKVRR